MSAAISSNEVRVCEAIKALHGEDFTWLSDLSRQGASELRDILQKIEQSLPPESFGQYITAHGNIGKEMNVEDALDVLIRSYHRDNEEDASGLQRRRDVLCNIFIPFKNHPTATVVFRQGINSGYDSIVMDIYDKGKFIARYHLNPSNWNNMGNVS